MLMQLFFGCLFFFATSSAHICESEVCKKVAGEFSQNLNPDVDPCDDFYQYACGRHGLRQMNLMSLSLVQQELIRRQIELLDDESLKEHGSRIVRQMKKEYDDCLNNDSEVIFNKTSVAQNLTGEDVNTFIPEGVLESEFFEEPNSRSSLCRNRASYTYRWAFIRIYLDKWFTLADQKATKRMISNVRSAIVKNLIDTISWLNEEQKKSAKERASRLELNTGYPDWVSDDEELDKEYDGEEHPRWPMDPLTVNAHYNFGSHEITIPAGILLPSVWDRRLPQYINYGGGAFVAGHEISHGLYRWTGDGKEWSERDDAYQCIIDQLDNNEDATTGKPNPMPGLNYLGEALADVGGINASLTAYRKIAKKLDEPQLPGLTHLSNEQLFFLAEANVWCINTNIIDLKSKLFKEWPSFFSHPPNYYRVILPAMNSPDFAKAFNCKAGSKMNPKNKCRMW